ncbi:acetyltransferase [Blastomonas marina]|uniref:Acetyltransferase n=1 Tax=Blastomonas marina TaxID=1867408 RepID=A0ABQ1FHG0_9SPHN|nr:GNAT family N-acetyltransferase [Blastomonas marina]GGA12262.1 acetyltransferase [Blastomonas marina]
MAEFRLETERLVLRDWRDEDWDVFFEHTNTPAVMQWLGGVFDDESREAQRARVENCRARNGFCFWLVERKSDGGHLAGEMLGFCGLKRADAPGSSVTGEIEIGWRFREESWGRGYAKEAAIAALDAAFDRFDAERVVSLTVEGNAPSWGLMKRLGMTRRPELDYADDRFEPPWRDMILYDIARDEWREDRPQ